jgi:hypothetical protein
LEAAYVGIDVACAKRKALPIVVCIRRQGRLVPLALKTALPKPPRGGGNVLALDAEWRGEYALQTKRYLNEIETLFSVRVARIAIDAPREPCRAGATRRMSEKALDVRHISCFTTPTEAQFWRIAEKARLHLGSGGEASRLPHAHQIWMLVGFDLFRRLSRTWECLEVYPQATVALLGCGALHKARISGLSAQMAAVAQHLGWERGAFAQALKASGFGRAHDQFDAYLAAWVASLEEADREPLGVPPSDAIWVPRFDPTSRRGKEG